jgi:hypothetical protein
MMFSDRHACSFPYATTVDSPNLNKRPTPNPTTDIEGIASAHSAARDEQTRRQKYVHQAADEVTNIKDDGCGRPKFA